MSSSRHLLPELPLVVQDAILENLDYLDLSSVSLSCRSLHHVTLKYLYRYLTRYESNRLQIEENLRLHPTLVRYIRSFSSYDRALLQWMYTQTTPPSLEWLDLKWEVNADNRVCYSNLVEYIPPSRRSDLNNLTITLNSSREAAMLNSLHAFHNLTFLTLYNHDGRRYPDKSWYTLQGVLDQLYAPSLRMLEIDGIEDWRIQWRETFLEQAFPKLLGVLLSTGTEWIDDVMWGPEALDEDDEGPFPPSSRMWNTVLAFYTRDINFDILLEKVESPFLDYAPSYAANNRLDPVGLIQRHVTSRMYFSIVDGFDDFDVNVGVIPLPDLATILYSIQPMETFGLNMNLSLNLPYDTESSIAQFLPHTIVQLFITAPGPDDSIRLAHTPASRRILDPSVIPACIAALPNLVTLNIYLKAFVNDFQPMNSCTVTTCSFPSLPDARDIENVLFKISRSSDPVWEVHLRGEGEMQSDSRGNKYYVVHPNIQQYNPDDEVVDFEREITDWFRLSTSLESVKVDFCKMRF
jgi:hypothetical protein